jgi:hypothetical protein
METLYRPPVAWAANIVLSQIVGYVFLSQALLNLRDAGSGTVDSPTLIGVLIGDASHIGDALLAVFTLCVLPGSVLFWVYVFGKSRATVWRSLNPGQALVATALYTAPAMVMFVVTLDQLPTVILFDAPIRRYDALEPSIRMALMFLTPLAFWTIANRFRQRASTSPD